MNRTDFYRMFAEEYSAKLGESKDACYAVFDLLGRCIKENDRVYIKGLGTFKKKTYKARRVGNLYGSEAVWLPEKEKIVFEPFNGSSDEDGE